MILTPAAEERRAENGAINPYVAQFTFTFIQMLTWAIIARALLSWFPIDQGSPLYQMLYRVTEPIIDPLRKVLPSTGMLDLSPMAAIIVLMVLGQFVLGLQAPA
ncbi:MAG: YggT family protein [Dehalococcoidia bacterium]|nr:YggT family protein [Chloroflexi bacterium CFX7]NUQ54366.1 YggT family protein [Dehalococcoidia bacterium]RIL02128.1 MAG: YggT family protein [bacterium]